MNDLVHVFKVLNISVGSCWAYFLFAASQQGHQYLIKVGFNDYCACILISGKNANEDDVSVIEGRLGKEYPNQEIYIVNGQQDVYDYIMIIQ